MQSVTSSTSSHLFTAWPTSGKHLYVTWSLITIDTKVIFPRWPCHDMLIQKLLKQQVPLGGITEGGGVCQQVHRAEIYCLHQTGWFSGAHHTQQVRVIKPVWKCAINRKILNCCCASPQVVIWHPVWSLGSCRGILSLHRSGSVTTHTCLEQKLTLLIQTDTNVKMFFFCKFQSKKTNKTITFKLPKLFLLLLSASPCCF